MSETPTTPPTEPQAASQPSTEASTTAATKGRDPLRSSRTSGAWIAVVGLGLVFVLLVVFIAQNTQAVQVSFLGWSGQPPLAVALLVATAAGLFLATVAGSLRILQLRRRVRRQKH
jgi:uncharacterized integral membrane protein